MTFDYEKTVQLLAYFAKREGGTISIKKAMLLMWIAERKHLRMHGRMITDSKYVATKDGPMSVEALEIFKHLTKLP